MTEANNLEEHKQFKLPRRSFLAAAVSAGVVLAQTKFNLLNGSSPEEAEAVPSIFETLSGQIDRSAGSLEDKTKVHETLSALQRIVKINDEFFKAYNQDVTEDGEPVLLSLKKKQFAPLQVEDPESMIGIVQNNKLTQELIVSPLNEYVTTIKASDRADSLGEKLAEIKEGVAKNKKNTGEQVFTADDHIHLIDYLTVGTEKGGKIEIEAADSGGELHDADPVVNMVEGLVRSIPAVGNTEVKVWSRRIPSLSGIDTQNMGGAFIESAVLSEVHLDSQADAIKVYHEIAGHGLDITLNDTKLYKYLSPETIYKLQVLKEKALSDEKWGRNYPNIAKTFASKGVDFVPSASVDGITFKITPPSSTRKNNLDDYRKDLDKYPDGIFVTGYYPSDRSNPKDRWFIRRDDEGVISEYRQMIAKEGQKSNSLSEFMSKNEVVLKTLGEKSPWLGKVFTKVESLLPVIDRKLSWLPSPTQNDPDKVNDYKIPGANDKDEIWFDFLTQVGQRLAIIDMFTEKDPALDQLVNSERDYFKINLLSALIRTDQEHFANMLALTLANPDIAQTSPYLSYLGELTQNLQASGTKLGLGSELTAELMGMIGSRTTQFA